jgi:hypothetical protein
MKNLSEEIREYLSRLEVSTQEQISEKWSNKYKKSINCNNPKGFSQKAHCAARKKRQKHGDTVSKPVNESLSDSLRSTYQTLRETGLSESSAYSMIIETIDENLQISEDLRKWFREKWVRFGPDGKIRGACARGKKGEGKPKCLPQAKARALGKKGRASAASRKRRKDPNPNRKGKAKNVATKESIEGQSIIESKSILQQLAGDDQRERHAYSKFLQNQSNDDWKHAAKLWSQKNNRSPDDIFLDTPRLKKFMSLRFDFDKFDRKDWQNYWILSQHADNFPMFQKHALKIIRKYLGTDHSHYRYLSDRLSNNRTGRQLFGTQIGKIGNVATKESYTPEPNHASLPDLIKAKSAIPQILQKVQQEYDNWDEANVDTYAGGGICHIIADKICEVFSDFGIECATISCSHEQHVYVAIKVQEGVYSVDIPYSIYETGGGFTWKKIPEVKFEPSDVIFYKITSDPEEFESYIEPY